MNIDNNKVILTKEVSIMDGQEKLFSIPNNTTGTIVKDNMDGTSDIEFNISIEDNLHNLNYSRECKIIKPIPHDLYRKVNVGLSNPLTCFLNGLEDAYDAGDVYITIPQNSIGKIIKDNGDCTCDVEFILKNNGVDGEYELKIVKTLHNEIIRRTLGRTEKD